MRPDPAREYRRWLKQAESDLDDARYSMAGDRHSLACFLSQQAAEKAVKAFPCLRGSELIRGHSVAELLKDAVALDPAFEGFRGLGGFLDRSCIITRYPNGLPGWIPSESFSRKDAEEAIGAAAESIAAVAAKGGGQGSGNGADPTHEELEFWCPILLRGEGHFNSAVGSLVQGHAQGLFPLLQGEAVGDQVG
jgi:HEPN domain-containing protein